ncbi:MAG: AAA family ATPase, partial [Planctomycetes bacterium]|nr:AAA family ATPase [Planctomycetota bacterium]
MTANPYIASIEPQSSKSLVALGVTEMLSRRISALGFFRPVIRAGDRPDNDIQLIRSRYRLATPYQTSFAMTQEEARRLVAAGDEEELLSRILARYKELEGTCECVVCEGTDFTGVAAAFEFDFNAMIANQLGCPVVIVASGQQKTPEEIVSALHAARSAFVDEGCEIAATIVNRVPVAMLDQVRGLLNDAWKHADPIFALPQESLLSMPTFGEIVAGLGARPLLGTEALFQREVRDYKVAAMHVPSLLDHLQEGSLVITPGDRADVMLGSLAAFLSENCPKIAGLLL